LLKSGCAGLATRATLLNSSTKSIILVG
jgi:hypothetical protein